MLLQRIVTSIVLIALLAFALWSDHPAVWPAFVAIAASFAAEEWSNLRQIPPAMSFAYALVTGLVAIGLVQPSVAPAALLPVTAMSLFFWVSICPLWLFRRWGLPPPLLHAFTGWVVIVPALLALNALKEWGIDVLFAVLCIVWVSDSSAYFVGRAIGRHRLAPGISPGKTWEGVVGAWVGVALLGELALQGLFTTGKLLLLLKALGWGLFPLLFVVVVLGMEGDLFESWLKRSAGIKDSGWILPGHGGVLDRIDALMAALPAVACGLALLPRGLTS